MERTPENKGRAGGREVKRFKMCREPVSKPSVNANTACHKHELKIRATIRMKRGKVV